jgi:hypothetical protein
VLLVHGLGGHPYNTWRRGDVNTAWSADETFWPLWLERDCNSLAVYVIGYEAPVSRWRGTAMHLTDLATNILANLLPQQVLPRGPLVFIGHSLGGLVIKQLLRTAESEARYDPRAFDLIARVGKVAFLGTPHSGAGLASLGDRLRILVRPSAATASLVRNDPNLRDLNNWYREWANDRGIAHLILTETAPTPILGMIVLPDSADPGLANVRAIPITADHKGVCKPANDKSEIYVLVRDFVSRPAERATVRPPVLYRPEHRERPESTALKNFFVEYLGLPDRPRPFGGRDKELEFLGNWLRDPDRPGKLVVTASAGRGKSALLVHWSHTVLKDDWQVVFVPISIRFGTATEKQFFPLLATSLATKHAVTLPAEKSDDAVYCRAFAESLLQKGLDGNRSLVVIIDGMDEAVGWQFNASSFPSKAPPGLKIIVSARERAGDRGPQGWIKQLNWDSFAATAEGFSLDTLTRDGVHDVLVRMGGTLAKLESGNGLLNELWRLTDGDPLLVRFYVEDLQALGTRAAELKPKQLRTLAKGYKGYFDKWMLEQHELWKGQGRSPVEEKGNRYVLTILACAKGPLSRSDIAQILHRGSMPAFGGTISGAVEPFGRFVVGDGSDERGYVLSHPKLAEYFRSGDFIEPGDVDGAVNAFLDWGRETLRGIPEEGFNGASVPSYLVQFYGKHLVESAPGELMTLVSNGWRLTWQHFQGGYSGFALDVRRAWKWAKRVGPTAGPNTGVLLPRLGDEIRCALCLSSIATITSNALPELLALAVSEGEWTLRQALDVIRQKPDRVQALMKFTGDWKLALDLPEGDRAAALKEILAAAETIVDDEDRAHVLRELALDVPEEERAKGEGMMRGTFTKTSPPDALAQLARDLPEGERAEAVREGLSALRANADDERQRAKDLTWLVENMPYLPAADWPPVARDVLNAVRTISDKRDLATALIELSYRTPEVEKGIVVKEALEAARAIDDVWFRDGRRTDRASELTKLVWHLPKTARKAVVKEALDAAVAFGDQVDHTEALIALVKYLPEAEKAGVVREALAVAKRVRSPLYRAWALIAVVMHLPETERAAIVKEALIPAISEAYELTSLSLSLPEAQRMAILQNAVRAASTNRSAKVYSCLNIEIARYLPEATRAKEAKEWLAAVPALDRYAAGMLIAILPLLAPDSSRSAVVREALAAAATIIDKNSSADELSKLAEDLSDVTMTALAREMLLAARATVDEERRASDLTWLTEYMLYLPDADWLPLGKGVLTAVRAIADKRHFATARVELLLPLPKAERATVIQEALESGARTFRDGGPAEALSALMPHMPEEERIVVMRERLPALLSEISKTRRAFALHELSLLLPAIHFLGGSQATLSAFRAIRDVCRWWP